MKKPLSSEYPSVRYFANYIEKVEDEDVIAALTHQMNTVENLYKHLTEDQQHYRYAEGKWTPKQLLGHMTDAERIFAFRALSIARGEKQSLPGFDENEYVGNADFNQQSIESLLEQYRTVRQSTLALARSLTEEQQTRIGTANGNPISARALFSIIAGHEKHHLEILRDKYRMSE